MGVDYVLLLMMLGGLCCYVIGDVVWFVFIDVLWFVYVGCMKL